MQSFYTLEECFKILGLNPAKKHSIEEIKKAYHLKAMQYHPDQNDDPLAKEIFQKIKEAYDIVTNPSEVFRKFDKSSKLNIILNINATFEEGFFGKDFKFNFNANTIAKVSGELDFEIQPVSFKLPKGSHSYYEKILKNKGYRENGKVGDLLIRVAITKHPKFIVQGLNVISQEQVKLEKLLKGGFLEVATMYGLKKIKIKPGTIPGTQKKIPNCGVGGSNYHIVILNVLFPDENELKNNEEWSNLDINWDLSD